MKTRHLPLVAALLSAFALAQVQAQTATPAAAPASAAAVAYSPANPGPGWYKHLVNLDFVKKQAAIPKIDGVMLIDSRPTARKYDIGHIPTAVKYLYTKKALKNPDWGFFSGLNFRHY